MEVISCCGVHCEACRFFPEECPGCPDIAGKVFWLRYTGEEICGIYQCCVVEKGLLHCGLCPEMPCSLFDAPDPTLSPEENQEIHRKQVQTLRNMADMEKGG